MKTFRVITGAIMILVGFIVGLVTLVLIDASGGKFTSSKEALIVFLVIGASCASIFLGGLLIVKGVKKEVGVRRRSQLPRPKGRGLNFTLVPKLMGTS